MRLTDFKALSFDCYGTLIDWESGMIAALEPLTDRVAPALKPLTDRVAPALGRDAILEAHAQQKSRQQRYTPAMCYSDPRGRRGSAARQHRPGGSVLAWGKRPSR